MSENSLHEPSALGTFLGVGSLLAGAVHGYYDSQGIPFEKKNLEWALTYAPAIIQGSIVGVIGGLAGMISGGVLASNRNFGDDSFKSFGKIAGDATLETAAIGAVGGGALGAISGALETLIGYGLGYFVGYLVK